MSRMRLLASEGKHRVLDRRADGFIPGEGVAVVVLKPLDRAVRDGDTIHAVIRGSAVNYSGRTGHLTEPSPEAEKEVVAEALARADVDPKSVSYIELNGAGTVLGDSAEANALGEIFSGNRSGPLFLGSVKSGIGNLEAASGLVGMIKVILSMRFRTLPAMLHFEQPNRFVRWRELPFQVVSETVPWDERCRPFRAGVSSFGVGGANVHVVLEECPRDMGNKGLPGAVHLSRPREVDEPPRLYVCSARSWEVLKQGLSRLYQTVAERIGPGDLGNLAYTLGAGREHFSHRLAWVVSTRDELLSAMRRCMETEIWESLSEEEGYFYGVVPTKSTSRKKSFPWMAEGKKEAASARRKTEFVFAFASFRPEETASWRDVESRGAPAWIRKVLMERKGKVNALLDRFLSSARERGFTLSSQVADKVERVLRGVAFQETAARFLWELGVRPVRTVAAGWGEYAKHCFENPDKMETICSDLVNRASSDEPFMGESDPPFGISDPDVFVFSPASVLRGAEVLGRAARAHVRGVSLRWELSAGDGLKRKLALPSYPFEGRRYWPVPDGVEPTGSEALEVGVEKEAAENANRASTDVGPVRSEDLAERINAVFMHGMVEKLGFRPEEIDVDRPLEAYGFDSIFLVSCLEELERSLGVVISRFEVTDASTLRGIVECCVSVVLRKSPASDTIRHTFSKNTRRTDRNDSEERIAVVGMAGRFPEADDLDEYWENLVSARESIVEVPRERFDLSALYDPNSRKPGKTVSKWAGLIRDIDSFDAAGFHVHPRALRSMDPQQRLLLQEARKALTDAGYESGDGFSKRVGVYIGVSAHEYAWRLLRDGKPLDHYAGLGTARSMAANRISHFFGFTGPSLTVDTACSSSLAAVHLAVRALQRGECDVALAGGVNLILDPSAFLIFSKAGVLSPSGRCRVFDDGGDGYVRGEAVGVVVLKTLGRALRNEDGIRGVVLGSALNHNGENFSITAPSLRGQIALLEEVYGGSGVDPGSISYVEAGSTGSREGDPLETRALLSVLGGASSPPLSCALGSVKPNIGHAEAASGIAGLLKTLLALQRKTIPPLVIHSNMNRAIDLSASRLFIPHEPLGWSAGELPRRAAVTSFGYGGANAHLVVEEAPSSD